MPSRRCSRPTLRSLFIADQTGLHRQSARHHRAERFERPEHADLLTVAGYLFDNNLGTGTDFRVNGSGAGALGHPSTSRAAAR